MFIRSIEEPNKILNNGTFGLIDTGKRKHSPTVTVASLPPGKGVRTWSYEFTSKKEWNR